MMTPTTAHDLSEILLYGGDENIRYTCSPPLRKPASPIGEATVTDTLWWGDTILVSRTHTIFLDYPDSMHKTHPCPITPTTFHVPESSPLYNDWNHEEMTNPQQPGIFGILNPPGHHIDAKIAFILTATHQTQRCHSEWMTECHFPAWGEDRR